VPYTDGETLTEFSLRDPTTLIENWSVWYWAQGVRPKDRSRSSCPTQSHISCTTRHRSARRPIAVLINWKSPRKRGRVSKRTGAIALYTDLERWDRIAPDLDKLSLRWIKTIEEMRVRLRRR